VKSQTRCLPFDLYKLVSHLLYQLEMAFRQYTENDIADAILAITDDGLSQHQAAQRYGIPKSILQNRMRGQEVQKDQIQLNQRITKNKEIKIRNWALQQKFLGYGLSHNQIRASVKALLKQRGDNTPLGVNWVSRFASKHPELKTKIGRV
jgi:hypothetical protein